MNPDPYRGIFGSDGGAYARDVQDHIDYGTSGNVAGFIAETVQVITFIVFCFSLRGLFEFLPVDILQ